MKMLGLDGKEYPFFITSSKKRGASGLHTRATKLLKKLFPKTSFSEEVSVKINRYKTLYLDIYIHVFNVAIEIDGKQHDEYTPFYHRTQMGYLEAQARDRTKEEWCELNNIVLIRLKEDESDRIWEDKIRNAVGGTS